MISEPKHCPDCGPTRVSHFAERLGAITERLFAPLDRTIGRLWSGFTPLFSFLRVERLALPLFLLLTSLGLGRIGTVPDDQDNLRTKCFWEEAKRRGIRMEELRLFGKPETNFFVASFKRQMVVFDGLPRPRGASLGALDWMDDKGIMKERFTAAGIPVARGKTCVTLSCAVRTFHELRKPVIAKPNLGSRSRHTTVHIKTESDLCDAFRKAKQLSPWVVIEEELEGMVFRATLIGSRVFGVIRREPPHVVGDDTHSVRQLVEEANKNPLRRGPVFHLIPESETATKELERQELSWESTPAHGRLVTLDQKISRSVGGTTTDVSDNTHPENINLFERIGKVLDDPLVGIDFIIEDISEPWHKQPRCGVIECNSLPFLDLHHYPFVGSSRNAAGALWDLIFPDSRR